MCGRIHRDGPNRPEGIIADHFRFPDWMFLVRWISRWPLGLLHAVGGLLGWLVWLCSPTYRRRLRTNADLAGVDARARRRSIAESGRMVAETPWLWLTASNDDLLRKVQWRGAEALEGYIAERRPLVILTPHMGSFEVAARAYTARWGGVQPVTVLYHPARQRALRACQEQGRRPPTLTHTPPPPAWPACAGCCAR